MAKKKDMYYDPKFRTNKNTFVDEEHFADSLEQYVRDCAIKKLVPMKCGFATYWGISLRTLGNAFVKYPDVRDKFNAYVENKLWQGLLDETYNSKGAMFSLNVNYGKIETKKQEITGKDGEQLLPTAINIVVAGDEDEEED